MKLRYAQPEEAGVLSDLALRSKAFWGYARPSWPHAVTS